MLNTKFLPVPGNKSAPSVLKMLSVAAVMFLFLLFFPAAETAFVMGAKTMVDGEYEIANGNNARGDSKKYSTTYDGVEYFDVYSPKIKSLYSQVYWADMEPVKLPQHIIDRFSSGSTTMAIVGYEIDQVIRNDGEGGNQDDIPVPITHAYNHHYMAYMYDSRNGQMVRRTIPQQLKHKTMSHGLDTMLQFEYFDYSTVEGGRHGGHGDAKNRNKKENYPSQFIPHAQVFSEGNGGEMRLSYHGYPKGYAQLIQSPDTFQVTPMQIDVWNRDGGSSPKFMPGPLPKSSPASRIKDDGGATYSGLLECPCSDRLERKIWNNYVLLPAAEDNCNHHQSSMAATSLSNACQEKDKIHNATECFEAGQYVLPSPHMAVHHVVEPYDPNISDGCTLVVRSNGIVDMYWNVKKNKISSSNELNDGEDTESNDLRVITHDNVVAKRTEQQKVKEVVAFASSILNATVTLISSLSTLTTHSDEEKKEDKAVITLVGPKDVWFGIGWGTKNMCRVPMTADVCPGTGPYAIIVAGDHVEERLLGYHGIGQVLESTVPYMSVISNTVAGDIRTVQVERPLKGLDDRYFDFNINATSIDVIMATGCSMTLAQHCGHGISTLNFLATDTRRTVCGDGELASIGGRVFHEGKRCAPFPQSTLVQQHNPTCSIHTYKGGQHCCHHMVSLLDQDQEIPWDDQPLEYQLKFRFYFEEYVPPRSIEESENENAGNQSASISVASDVESSIGSHQHLVRLYWMTEARAGEYDIIQCPPGTPSSQCVQVISSQWTIPDMLSDMEGEWGTGINSTKADGVKLIYAAPHCHAPSCLSIELYNADTGALLCHVEPRPGKSTDKVYDELGFLAIPPCLWGNKADGLVEPVFLPLNTTLLSIKRNNSTLSHYGEMASWQMRGIVVVNDNSSNNKQSNDGNHDNLVNSLMDDRDIDPSVSTWLAVASPAVADEERSLRIRRRGDLG